MKTRRTAAPVLSQRALNRSLLERQHLLQRRRASALSEIEHLVAMQAQVPNSPYVGLWTRLEEFQPAELARLIMEKRAVRLGIMRNTLHLLSARDALALRPLFNRVLERVLQSSPFGSQLQGSELRLVVAEGTRLLRQQPRTLAQLGSLLQQRWPGRGPTALGYAIRHLVPLVQVPPRGIWGKTAQPTWTTLEHWLDRPVERKPDLDALVLRYLAAFGPASVADMAAWSGLTALRPTFERLRPDLRIYQDERGRELFDLPDAPHPDPKTPAPPRFLPEYDNIVLGHQDRTRVIAFEHRHVILYGMFLLDGFLAGTWSMAKAKDGARLTVSSFKPLKRPDRAGLAEEGERLLSFAAPGSARGVDFVEGTPRNAWSQR